jgi:hypothetical protein
MWRCGRTITARGVCVASAAAGVIRQPIIVKPATTTTEPGRILARKLRRLIALTGFSPLLRVSDQSGGQFQNLGFQWIIRFKSALLFPRF